MTVPSAQQSAEAAELATPKKAVAKVEQLLSPVSELKSPGQPADDLEVEDWDPVKDTAVHPAQLPAGADLVLVSVPLDINSAQLEGAEMVFPSDSLATGRIGSTIEVKTVHQGQDAGMHVLGIAEGVPSAAKVAALYSLQYSLPEPGAEEEAVDVGALEALRSGVCGV